MSDLISRQAAEGKLKKVVDEMALIFSDIREKNVDDSVCGLCEYDCDHGIDGCSNECPGFERDDCFNLKEEYKKEWTDLSDIPSVEPERKMGKWILLSDDKLKKMIPGWHGDTTNIIYQCSSCGKFAHNSSFSIKDNRTKYCDNCGAKMEVV